MKYLNFIIGLLLLVACANKPCRDPQTEAGKNQITPSARAFVARSDGSKQCKGSGISESTMQKELKGITVYSSKKDHDGLMRIQVCGADTGRFNVFEIDAKDLEKAKSLGFEEWTK